MYAIFEFKECTEQLEEIERRGIDVRAGKLDSGF